MSSVIVTTDNGIVIDIPGMEGLPDGTEFRDSDTVTFLSAIGVNTDRLEHLSHRRVTLPGKRYYAPELGGKSSIFFQVAREAFNLHVPLTLAPETLWQMVVDAIAREVKKSPAAHAPLFTDTPGKKKSIVVRDDSLVMGQENDWARAIGLFRGALGEHITSEVLPALLPRFSTMSVEAETAILLAFMDAASPYYEYGLGTLCGIPKFKLVGTVVDWQLFESSLARLHELFPTLASWLGALRAVVAQIVETASTGTADASFWKSAFTYGSDRQGDSVDGWLTLFARVRNDVGEFWTPVDPASLERGQDVYTRDDPRRYRGRFRESQLPLQISFVDFSWEYGPGNFVPMKFVGGVLGAQMDGEFIVPELGFAVAHA